MEEIPQTSPVAMLADFVVKETPVWSEKGCGLTEACLNCGLYNKTPVWSMKPMVDPNARTIGKADKPYILVVGSHPTEEESFHLKAYDKTSTSWRLPMTFLGTNGVECRWVATTAITCHPGKQEDETSFGRNQKDNVPTKQQILACSSQNLAYLQRTYKAKVIICLGEAAMHAVLGKYAPKKVSSMGTTPFRIPDTDTIVFVLEHPTKHYPKAKKNPRDLWPEYKEVFSTAEQIALKGIPEHDIDWYEVSDPAKAMEIAKRMPERFSFDVEDSHHDKSKTKRTIYHPGSRLICLGLCFRNPSTGKLEVPVLTGAACHDKRVLEAIFTNRIASGYNVKYDISALRALCDFDVFAYVKYRTLHYNGVDYEVPGIEDPILKIYLGNQGNTGKGINKIACAFWGIPDWKLTVKYALLEANQKIAENNKAIKAAQKKMIAFDINNDRLLNGDKKQKATAKAWFKKNPDIIDVLTLPPLREEGSADFGDIPLAILLPYNAKDVYYEYLIGEEYVPTLVGTPYEYNVMAYILMLRMTEVTCKVEHNGVALNEARLDAALEQVDKLTENAKLALLKQPEVLRTIQSLEKLRKLSLKPKWPGLTKDVLKQMLAPTASPFKVELAKQLGNEHLLGRTKGGDLGCDRHVLSALCGDQKLGRKGVKLINKELLKNPDPSVWRKEWAKLTRSERIWFSVRGLLDTQQLKAKFLTSYKKYTVDGRVRGTFKTIRAESDSGGADSGGESGTKQGRLSMEKSNLQQIKQEKALRSLFKAGKNKLLLEIDYSSGEVVTTSVAMGVKRWIKHFSRPKPLDLYASMANDIFQMGVDTSEDNPKAGVDLEAKIPKDGELRNETKTNQLAKIYGQTVEIFAKRTGLTLAKAQEFFDMFDSLYPEIRQYREEIQRKILSEEPIETSFGRKTFYQKPNAYDEFAVAKVVRTALNFKPQSDLSDINLYMGWIIQKYIEQRGWENKVKIILFVHDAIYFEVDCDIIREFTQFAVKTMENTDLLPFPFPNGVLKCAAKFGTSLHRMSKKLDRVKLFRKFCRKNNVSLQQVA